ncbi:HMG box-containing protein [Coccidioides immitis RS]|uniref:HMG box-containing protein n=2 Tax=Coccidioides immitis TaxID=5501 RepID=J3KJU9_COCIM|nr:HMG box-containing protein [Coccidioides immitis RS]EAS36394.3 HMG box-containing protein [Coccidioides immitis RS]KMP01749.1 hypothetical protein CIRG_01888 [Coccidioides immitis RMSCC 2394]TPX25475.1 hypothetical protein DIZ76_010930 [Coccidioides immitis]
MARLRQAPSNAPEATGSFQDSKVVRENEKAFADPVHHKYTSPVIRRRDNKEKVTIYEDEPDKKDYYKDDEEYRRGDSGYLDLDAEESGTEDSETGILDKDRDQYGSEEEESEDVDDSEASIERPGPRAIESTGLGSHRKRRLRPLGFNKKNILYQVRRVSGREESRYNDYSSDNENTNPGSGDYEKENDEKGLFNETKSSASSARPGKVITESRFSVGKRIKKPSITEQYISEKDEKGRLDEGDDDDDGDDDDGEFDSLDDFIVGDDENISYHESTDEIEESEDEIIVKPRTPARRLFRGRRPQNKENTTKNTNVETNTQDAPDASDIDDLAEILNKTKLSKPDLQPKLSFRKAHPVLPERKDQDSSKMSDDDESDGAQSSNNQPIKKVVEFVTPPTSPSKPRLQSPKKTPKRIPPSPYRPSIDAFWSQDIINGWNDKFSPKKLQSPRKWPQTFTIFSDNQSDDNGDENSPLSSPEKAPPLSPKKAKGSPTKSIAAIKKAEKREFDKRKVSLAEKFFKELDDSVTGGEIQKLAAAAGGVRIIWSNKLNTTAGRASWKREHIKQKQPTQTASSCFAASHNSSDSRTASSPEYLPSQAAYRHHASIELADKVVDSDDRLFNTLAHEYCHLANYMISNVRDNPHGASFKAWAQRCKKALNENPSYAGRVEITTKHTYAINYKYIWCCVECAHEYGRHSRSIDPEKSRCGKCKGKLVQIQPKPRKTAAKQGDERNRTGLKELAGGADAMLTSMGSIRLNS